MPLGPIEIVELVFPGNQFNGSVLPELERLLEAGTITLVDGLFALKDEHGDVSFAEVDEEGLHGAVGHLARLVDRRDELLTEEDVADLTADLEPDCSAAILVFEHTWVKPLRDAVVASGGRVAANVRIPGPVVDEVLSTLENAG